MQTQKKENHWVEETENKRTTHPSEMLVRDREKENLRRKENIHCHLRYGYFVAINQIVMTTVHML